MKPWIVWLVAFGCDGSIREHGVVTDAVTHEPIAGARVWFGDRAMNQGLASYLDRKTASPGPPDATTDEHGAFAVGELAAPGERDVWIVVRAQGHVELHRQLWKATGPHPDQALALALVPSP